MSIKARENSLTNTLSQIDQHQSKDNHVSSMTRSKTKILNEINQLSHAKELLNEKCLEYHDLDLDILINDIISSAEDNLTEMRLEQLTLAHELAAGNCTKARENLVKHKKYYKILCFLLYTPNIFFHKHTHSDKNKTSKTRS